MFDALLESNGSLKTQSKYWTLLTFGLNAGLVATLTLFPLLYPEALPHPALMEALVIPAPPPPPAPAAATAVARQTPAVRTGSEFTTPPRIPNHLPDAAAPPSYPVGVMPMGPGGPGNDRAQSDLLSLLGRPAIIVAPPPPVKPRTATPVRVSTGVAAGNLIVKTPPVYPVIARAAGVHGNVVLRAVISKSGGIENLTVESGPPMLRQAALDGVRTWRYRPFLLNGEPTEVDTTITVNFTTSN